MDTLTLPIPIIVLDLHDEEETPKSQQNAHFVLLTVYSTPPFLTHPFDNTTPIHGLLFHSSGLSPAPPPLPEVGPKHELQEWKKVLIVLSTQTLRSSQLSYENFFRPPPDPNHPFSVTGEQRISGGSQVSEDYDEGRPLQEQQIQNLMPSVHHPSIHSVIQRGISSEACQF